MKTNSNFKNKMCNFFVANKCNLEFSSILDIFVIQRFRVCGHSGPNFTDQSEFLVISYCKKVSSIYHLLTIWKL